MDISISRKVGMKLQTKEQKLRDTLGLLIPYTDAEIKMLSNGEAER